MAVADVWVELRSQALGVRLVRADTIVQVWWDVKRPSFLNVTLSSPEVVRQDVRAGLPAHGIEEGEASDLCEELVQRIARAAHAGGGHLVWMRRDEGSRGSGWTHRPLVEARHAF
ncbi:hypothetical protein ACFYXM_02375 [Streptomyces sp. NPDC002476]|uniref:hypothetical protein n=1 Tax=Streptomyces sp. NPDC002476 TaxID=3364648 RepID=UPI00368A7149